MHSYTQSPDAEKHYIRLTEIAIDFRDSQPISPLEAAADLEEAASQIRRMSEEIADMRRTHTRKLEKLEKNAQTLLRSIRIAIENAGSSS